jgi:hypothetical protein
VGKQHVQTIESKHSNLQTRIKRLARRTMCFAKTTILYDLGLAFSSIAMSASDPSDMESTALKHLFMLQSLSVSLPVQVRVHCLGHGLHREGQPNKLGHTGRHGDRIGDRFVVIDLENRHVFLYR